MPLFNDLKKSNFFRWAMIALAGVFIAAVQNCGGMFNFLRIGKANDATHDEYGIFSATKIPEVTKLTSPMAGVSPIVIKTSNKKNAGAITSLTWNQKEFLDTFDKGRLLQSTISFGGHGECFNPVEAGAFDDEPMGESSSRLLSATAGKDKLNTVTQMAFWLRGNSKGYGCPTGKAENGDRVLSDHFVERTVQVNANADPHVLLLDTTFRVGNDFPAFQPNTPMAVFEAAAGFMHPDFERFYIFDIENNSFVEEPNNVRGEQDKPVIIATADLQHAIGVFSPQLPQNGIGYGRYSFADLGEASSSKWSCNFRVNNRLKPDDYKFHCYLAIGDFEQVKESMRGLVKTFKKYIPKNANNQENKLKENPMAKYDGKQINGYIDGIFDKNDGKVLAGWACIESLPDNLTVDISVGEAKGKVIAKTKTAIPSEPEVNKICLNDGAQTFRFEVALDSNLIEGHAGKKIFATALHPMNKKELNLTLQNSGTFKVPNKSSLKVAKGTSLSKAKKSKKGSVIGEVDGIFNEGQLYFLHGWACQQGSDSSVKVYLKVGDYLVSDMTTANEPAESAVWEKCNVDHANARFKFEIPLSWLEGLTGETIYVTAGPEGTKIENHSKFTIPRMKPLTKQTKAETKLSNKKSTPSPVKTAEVKKQNKAKAETIKKQVVNEKPKKIANESDSVPRKRITFETAPKTVTGSNGIKGRVTDSGTRAPSSQGDVKIQLKPAKKKKKK